jgi:hypothetical protein
VALCVVVWNVVTGEKLAMLEIKVITVMVCAPALDPALGTPTLQQRGDGGKTVR